jgi:hypothetical protein
MIQLANMLMIGAGGRNVGKTEFACRLISKLSASQSVIGVKVTTIHETRGACPRGGDGCGVCSSLEGRFWIREEHDSTSKKDTARVLSAGAERVYWLCVRKEHLVEGLHELLKKIPPDLPIVCESNSLRLAVEPGLFLIMRDDAGAAMKPSAAQVADLADKVVVSDGEGFDLSLDDVIFDSDGWSLASLPDES